MVIASLGNVVVIKWQTGMQKKSRADPFSKIDSMFTCLFMPIVGRDGYEIKIRKDT